MKKAPVMPGRRTVPVTTDPQWDQIIQQIKGLPVERRLKLAENIHADAVEDIRVHQGKLQGELSQLANLLGTPGTPGPTAPVGRPSGNRQPVGRPAASQSTGSHVRDKILAVLRRGGMTVNQIKAATKQQWVAAALSNLVQSRQIVSDGNRPAIYSLAR